MPRYYRKVIHIRAEDSPNVKLALAELEHGRDPSHRIIVDGVLPYADYAKRRKLWDKVRQCIGLDGRFYAGAELLLFPPDWLNRAERLYDLVRGRNRRAKAIGIDPAEGGDSSAFAAVDDLGIIEVESIKTPDTTVITTHTLAFARRHGLIDEPEKWVFDRGGGGKQHADRLRLMGYDCRTVAFGESVALDIKPTRVLRPVAERVEVAEERYTYFNRRAEMYGEFSLMLDPALNYAAIGSFAIPAASYGEQYVRLRKQLSVIPKLYDNEGRLVLPPKQRKPGQEVTKQKTLIEMIGHSPDEADAVVVAVYGMRHKVHRPMAGAAC